jgi:hypothetical protein
LCFWYSKMYKTNLHAWSMWMLWRRYRLYRHNNVSLVSKILKNNQLEDGRNGGRI